MAQTKQERAAYDRAYRAAHREERTANQRAWYEAHREEQAAYGETWRAAHREERAAYNRAWRAAHWEEVAAYNHAYQKAHRLEYAEHNRRRHALKHEATIGPIDLEAIKARDKMRCAICGKKVAERDLSFDHSHPLVLLGPHSQENLRVAHLRCNSRRGAGRLPVQMVLV